jgi:hypothetical protein
LILETACLIAVGAGVCGGQQRTWTVRPI